MFFSRLREASLRLLTSGYAHRQLSHWTHRRPLLPYNFTELFLDVVMDLDLCSFPPQPVDQLAFWTPGFKLRGKLGILNSNLLNSWGCTDLLSSNVLNSGSDKLLNFYCNMLRLNGTVYPIGICYRYVFLSYSITRAICRVWHTVPQGQGITYLSRYNYIVYAFYPIPTYPQDKYSPGIQQGASTSSTDVNTDPNIPNRHGPWPNISNRCRYQANKIFLPLQLSVPAPQSIPTDAIPG